MSLVLSTFNLFHSFDGELHSRKARISASTEYYYSQANSRQQLRTRTLSYICSRYQVLRFALALAHAGCSLELHSESHPVRL